MNTSALKTFAQKARLLLREGVERRLRYWGFDAKGNNTETLEAVAGGYVFRGRVGNDTTVPAKWNKLKKAVADTSFDEVVEKAAYTWFNRLLAIKILGKNGYETAQLDYLTLDTHTPAVLERARRGQYGFLTPAETTRLQAVLTDYEKEEEAFAILLIGYSHQHPLIQGIFGSIDDYTELLLPDDMLAKSGFLHFLNTTTAITDEDYKQVELIGWLYQFYISEKKDEVFAGFKAGRKAEAKDIPAATQIFTPNWIVKYMVQNTLGRTWLDAHPDSTLRKDWKYLVEPAQPEEKASEAQPPTDHSPLTIADPAGFTFLDPAAGSGHILVEAFDTLYPMYLEEFYNPEEAVENILQKNIYGLDLDTRAAQLAQFALILKAAQYSRSVLQGKLLPHVYAMPVKRYFTKEEVALFLGTEGAAYQTQLYKALQVMEDAQNLGSIMVLELGDEARDFISKRLDYWLQRTPMNFEEEIIKEVFPIYISILDLLSQKYSCIVANPPYMSNKNMNAQLKRYVEEKFPHSKNDLYSVFVSQCQRLVKKSGRISLVTQQSWMFLISFESFRRDLLDFMEFQSMIHLGANTFSELTGEVVQATSFVLKNVKPTNKSEAVYVRLVGFDSSLEKESNFLSLQRRSFLFVQRKFDDIPGRPFAYWASSRIRELFQRYKTLSNFFPVKKGIDTGKNELFLKYWHEVSKRNISGFDSSKKWFFYVKGGGYRKWYGNFELVINWENDGREIRKHPSSTIRNPSFLLNQAVTWSLTSSNQFGARVVPANCIFDNNGSSVFPGDNVVQVSSILNNVVSRKVLSILNPTLAFQVGDICRVPLADILFKEGHGSVWVQLASKAVEISERDWNRRETSFNFGSDKLVSKAKNNLQKCYEFLVQELSSDFAQLHKTEEELNRIFIQIYGLDEELEFTVSPQEITILETELDHNKLALIQASFDEQVLPICADVIFRQFISYLLGCYMGRYRLDQPGLHIAHPLPAAEELQPYTFINNADKEARFEIDDDGIIPLMGSNGNFTDDLLHRVPEFLTVVWGQDTLTANLNFLQQQLGQDLEDYLVKDFWRFHTRMYSKKPIYWLFASKKGAFQVLVYMHRMNAYTLGRIRSKYLLPHINWLQQRIREGEKNAASLSRPELKKLDLQRKQLAECEAYDLLLKDLADQQIAFDLDNGVTKNYALFEGVVAPIK